MTLTKTQSKAVARATDLLRRLRNEKRRGVKLSNQEAVAATEFHKDGPAIVQRLLTTIKQLSAVEDRKDEVLRLEAECSRLRHGRNVYQERAGSLEKDMRGLTTSLEHTVEWLRQRAAAEFIDEPGDTAVKLREVFVEVKKLLDGKTRKANPYPWVNDGQPSFQVIAPMCVQHTPKEPSLDEDEYLLSLPSGERLTTDQMRQAHDWLVDIGHGELNFSLFDSETPTRKVNYTLGVRVQTWFFQTLGLKLEMVRAPR